MAASLDRDTVADKLLRFAIGAFIGSAGAWMLFATDYGGDMAGLRTVVLTVATATGVAAVVFGNAFIEGVIRGGGWH